MILKDKRTIVRAFAKQYQRGRKKEKTILLTKIAKSTGYHRKYLGRILHNPPGKRRITRHRVSPYRTFSFLNPRESCGQWEIMRAGYDLPQNLMQPNLMQPDGLSRFKLFIQKMPKN